MITLLSFLVLIGVVVVIHEYGHYKVATLCGVKVLKFSMGFGRPLIAWQLSPFRRVRVLGRDGEEQMNQAGLAKGEIKEQVKESSQEYLNAAVNPSLSKRFSGVVPDPDKTIFIISAIPLGGYVQMLDSKLKGLKLEDKLHSFDAKPLWARSLIVFAGPLANLILAVILYASLQWIGYNHASAVLATPGVGTVFEQSGLRSGDQIKRVTFYGPQGRILELETTTYESLQEAFIKAFFSDQRLFNGPTQSQAVDQAIELGGVSAQLSVARDSGQESSAQLDLLDRPTDPPNLDKSAPILVDLDLREWLLGLGQLDDFSLRDQALARLGMNGPRRPPLVQSVVTGGVAQLAGLRAGDMVIQINNRDIPDAQALLQAIRESPASDAHGQAKIQNWRIKRLQQMELNQPPGALNSDIFAEKRSDLYAFSSKTTSLDLNKNFSSSANTLELQVLPRKVLQGDRYIGRVDAIIGGSAQMVFVRSGFVQGFEAAVQRCLSQAFASMDALVKMLSGQLTWKALGGPLTMAEAAGKSAQLGWVSFVSFMAFVSVGVAVLNLLPIPLLDGGQLMYYLWEFVRGEPLDDQWQARLARFGLAALILMMGVALCNDVVRLLE